MSSNEYLTRVNLMDAANPHTDTPINLVPRNLDKRVEIMFPVEDPELKKQVIHILEVQLADNVKAHILQPDGTYEKIDKRGRVLVAAQEQFCAEAVEAAGKQAASTDIHDTRVFIPAEPQA